MFASRMMVVSKRTASSPDADAARKDKIVLWEFAQPENFAEYGAAGHRHRRARRKRLVAANLWSRAGFALIFGHTSHWGARGIGRRDGGR